MIPFFESRPCSDVQSFDPVGPDQWPLFMYNAVHGHYIVFLEVQPAFGFSGLFAVAV